MLVGAGSMRRNALLASKSATARATASSNAHSAAVNRVYLEDPCASVLWWPGAAGEVVEEALGLPLAAAAGREDVVRVAREGGGQVVADVGDLQRMAASTSCGSTLVMSASLHVGSSGQLLASCTSISVVLSWSAPWERGESWVLEARRPAGEVDMVGGWRGFVC